MTASWAGAVALLAAGCGGASSSPAAPSSAVSHRAPISLKVMTFNMHHGIDGSGRYNLQRAIDAIARVQPDLVGLQEVTRNHPSYGCDDQPQKMASGLRSGTGQTWVVAYQQEWFTPDTSCQNSGRGDGPETEGLVILTRRMVSGSVWVALPDSRLGLEVTVQDAYGIPVVVTHLTSGGSATVTRAQQVDRLLGWARGFGEPRIVMGDFNAAPQGSELQPILAVYRDAWNDAVETGRAGGAGNSKGGSRVDYVFYLPGGSMTLESAEVVDTAVAGVQASDHQPVVATFTIR